jgi:predicted peptidase
VLKQIMTFLCVLPFMTGLAHGKDKALAVKARGPGLHREKATLADGTTVRFTVSVPKGYKPGKKSQPKLPLILALHYGGKVTPFYGAGLVKHLVGEGFAKLKGIIVAPDSLGDAWRGGRDERAVIALLDGVMKAYSIHSKRVIVTGFSMGGAGAWYFALKYPERFSALVPVAGRPTGENLKIPVFAIHSTADKVVPIGPAKALITALKKKGHNARIVISTKLKHFDVSSYARHLKESVTWIRAVWKTADKAEKAKKAKD